MGAFLGLLFGIGILFMIHPPVKSNPFRNRLAFISTWIQRREELLRQAGIDGVSPLHLTGAQVGVGTLIGLATWIVTGSMSVALCFLAFGMAGPLAVVHSARRRRIRELRTVWPETIDNLSSGVRAGMALPEALAALAIRGPDTLKPAFSRFASNYRVSGNFSHCLDALKADLADPVADKICESLRLAKQVGGTELGKLLRTLSTFLREDARIRSEMEARQSWTINAARLSAASPWLVLLLLATQKSTLTAFDTTGGRLLLAGGAAVTFLAYRLMLRIGRLPTEKRVLL